MKAKVGCKWCGKPSEGVVKIMLGNVYEVIETEDSQIVTLRLCESCHKALREQWYAIARREAGATAVLP